MGNLETAQQIWEETTKSFEKMSEKEKKEWFKSLIEDLEENSSINRIKKQWNSMTEDQQLKLYKRNAITMSENLKNWSIIYRYYRSLTNWAINTVKNWWKNAIKFAFLEQIPCRFFVELWIFDKPKWLTEEKLIDDVKKDAKNFDLYLWFCSTVCTCIPEARPAVPFIWIAKHYTKRYKDNWTEIIKDRLTKQKKLRIKEQINEALSSTITDIKTQSKKKVA